jgi:hypothetical protein
MSTDKKRAIISGANEEAAQLGRQLARAIHEQKQKSMSTDKLKEEILQKLIDVLCEANGTGSGAEDFLKVVLEESEKLSVGFAEWKEFEYVNYQMQEGKYYHSRDLLKHISEATVFTTAELFKIYLDHLNKQQSSNER